MCNGFDDDCDGQVDEGNLCPAGQTCTGGRCEGVCQPQPEVCDGWDNDCDGQVDENLFQDCETACGAGTEECVNGRWRNCDAPEPRPEVCGDGLDNDCDGHVDEGCADCQNEEIRLRAEADTSRSSADPRDNFGQHHELRVGNGWDFFVRFPIDDFEGANITEARLRFKVVRVANAPSFDLRACQISRFQRWNCPWDENGPNWNWLPTRRNCTTTHGSRVNPGNVFRFDVTDAVREWASGRGEHCGFWVTMEEPPAGAIVRFHSDEGGDDNGERPRLEVTCGR